MAFTLDASNWGTASGISNTGGAGPKLAIAMFANDTANNPTSVTYGGQTMTGLTHTTNGAQGARIFYLINPPTGTQSLAYTLAGNHRACISTYNVAAGKTAAYDSVENGAAGTGTGPSAAVTPNNQPNVIVTCCAHEGANVMTGAGSGQTALVDADGFVDEGTWNSAFSYEATTSTASDTQSFTNGASDTYSIRTAVFKEVDGPINVTPGNATLTLTAQTPTVTATANQNVAPGATTLTLTRFTPTVVATDNKNVLPGATSLTLTPFAPTVTVAAGGVEVIPGSASLTLTPQTPTVSVSDNKTVLPGAASLTLTGFAPTVATTVNVNVTPGPASLSLTAFAPTVEATGEPAYVGNPVVGGRRYRIIEDPDKLEEELRKEEKIVEKDKRKLRLLIKQQSSPSVQGFLYQQLEQKIEKLEAKIDDRMERITFLLASLEIHDDEEEELLLMS